MDNLHPDNREFCNPADYIKSQQPMAYQIKVKIASIVIVLFTLITIGTVSYKHLENWGWVDSLYFSTTTLTTIGFGDLHPTTTASKLFTVGFVLVGVSFVLFSLSLIAASYYERGHRIVENTVKYAEEKINDKRKPWKVRRSNL